MIESGFEVNLCVRKFGCSAQISFGGGGGGCQLVGPDTKLEGQAPSIKWKGGGVGGGNFFFSRTISASGLCLGDKRGSNVGGTNQISCIPVYLLNSLCQIPHVTKLLFDGFGLPSTWAQAI